jgi:hypothetical protein
MGAVPEVSLELLLELRRSALLAVLLGLLLTQRT